MLSDGALDSTSNSLDKKKNRAIILTDKIRKTRAIILTDQIWILKPKKEASNNKKKMKLVINLWILQL